MKLNRRDILKFFGAGTIIAPLSVAGPSARLIEPPKVELFKEIPGTIDFEKVKQVKLILEMDDGSVSSLDLDVGWRHGKTRVDEEMTVSIQAYPLASSPVSYRAYLNAYRNRRK